MKTECPLNSDCREEDVIYECTALTIFQPKKVYLGFAEGEFKRQRFYNHTQSFETRTIRTAHLSPVMFEKYRKQKRKHQH